MSITIAINQLEKRKFTELSFGKLMKACGGENANPNKPIPLTEILDLTDLYTTLWCFTCLPKHQDIPKNFTLICAKEASTYSEDERVHDCVRAIENYLTGDANEELLLAAQVDADLVQLEAPNIVTKNAATTVFGVVASLIDPRLNNVATAAITSMGATETAASQHYETCECEADVCEAEKQKQTILFRELLES